MAKRLRDKGYEVFSPAERDNAHHETDISAGNLTGDVALATTQHGFSLREARAADTAFIGLRADGIAMLPGWENSKGAIAEKALAEALGLEVIYLDESTD